MLASGITEDSERKKMQAIQWIAPGPPSHSTLRLTTLPIPEPGKDQVLIKIHAFGLNRSELFTRQGLSGNAVSIPRVLGIEATGTVAVLGDSTSPKLNKGDVVMTCMGGLGRAFDGGYAEYTVVPVSNVKKISSTYGIGWEVLGAMPEMLQTANGALTQALNIAKGETLLIRGGSTSIGLAAAAIAKHHGLKVIGTTRDKGREELLKEAGFDEVVIDTGSIAGEIQQRFSGVHKLWELVGVTSLKDSLRSLRPGGVCCMSGMVGNSWKMDQFEPMGDVPHRCYLTTYGGGPEEWKLTPINEFIDMVHKGSLRIKVGRVFKMDQLVEAHECMESNKAGGKVVVLTPAGGG